MKNFSDSFLEQLSLANDHESPYFNFEDYDPDTYHNSVSAKTQALVNMLTPGDVHYYYNALKGLSDYINGDPSYVNAKSEAFMVDVDEREHHLSTAFLVVTTKPVGTDGLQTVDEESMEILDLAEMANSVGLPVGRKRGFDNYLACNLLKTGIVIRHRNEFNPQHQ